VEVSRAQLPRPLLLGRDGGCEGQIPSPKDPCSQGTSTLQLGPISAPLCQFLPFLMTVALILQDLGCVCSDPRGVTLAEDVASRETNRAKNKM
jgi:hypothetical protein